MFWYHGKCLYSNLDEKRGSVIAETHQKMRDGSFPANLLVSRQCSDGGQSGLATERNG
jgi:hypothetical protein